MEPCGCMQSTVEVVGCGFYPILLTFHWMSSEKTCWYHPIQQVLTETEWRDAGPFLCFWFAARAINLGFQKGHSSKSLQGSAINLRLSLDCVSETNTTWVANKRSYYRGNGGHLCAFGFPEEDGLTRIKMLHMVWDWKGLDSILIGKEQAKCNIEMVMK